MDKTLNQQLAELGYTTSPAGFQQKNILKDGVIVFTGRAGDVWKWLNG
jgi:hypothetical protein